MPRTRHPMRPGALKSGRRLAVACALVVLGGVLTFGASSANAQTIPPRPQALGEFWITYYWFVPEQWFTTKRIVALGLVKPYREDFLFSARGIAMQGTGTGDDGVMLHWRSGKGAWVNKDGAKTDTAAGGFTNGSPFARPGGCTWWTIGPDGKPGADTKRPTFPNDDGTWTNPPVDPASVLPVCDRVAATAKAEYPTGHDWNSRGYPDTFGIGIGAAVKEWRSIATDRSVIPKGTAIYIEAFKDTPSKGCFIAEDTGGAIIGRHIDVLVPPDKTLKLPSKGDLTLLPVGVDCPPPAVLAPGPFGDLNLSYLVPAAERATHATRTSAAGLGNLKLRESFLYGITGVVARALGTTAKGRTIVALGGGWWVNARGKKTLRKADGTWSKGAPRWRDGGWRTRQGRPTFRRSDGRWAWGKGVRHLRYRDRFRSAQKGEFVPWRTVASTKATAPLGTLLALDNVPPATCLVVNRLFPKLPQRSLQVVVPAGTNPASLPALSPATVLAATVGTSDGCPA